MLLPRINTIVIIKRLSWWRDKLIFKATLKTINELNEHSINVPLLINNTFFYFRKINLCGILNSKPSLRHLMWINNRANVTAFELSQILQFEQSVETLNISIIPNSPKLATSNLFVCIWFWYTVFWIFAEIIVFFCQLLWQIFSEIRGTRHLVRYI